MSENTDLLPGAATEDLFEVQVRGYNRRQVEEFAARSRRRVQDLDDQLTRAQSEAERLRRELAAARQAEGGRPAREEPSGGIAQILKLAADEAVAQEDRVAQEIAALRTGAQQETDAYRAQGGSQARQILAAALEQAERATTKAGAHAEKTTSAAQAEAALITATARERAKTATDTATAKARQILEEATARAAAIRDSADVRLGQIKDSHAEAMQQLTEIRNVVTGLLVRNTVEGTMHDEVASTAATLAIPGGQVTPR